MVPPVPDGEPFAIERDDGWYVEVVHNGHVYSAGPTTKEKAATILSEVRSELKAGAH